MALDARRMSLQGQQVTTLVLGFLTSIRRQWHLVLLVIAVSVVLTIVTIVIPAQLSPRYASEATILLTGSKYNVKLDDKITTIDALNLQTAAGAARADEYRALALSPDVRARVASQVGNDVSFTASVLVRGALLFVQVTTNNQDRAMTVCEAYVRAVAARLDDVYGQTEADEMAFREQAALAESSLREAENRLTTFLQSSRVDEYRRQLEMRQVVRATLSSQVSEGFSRDLSSLYSGLVDVRRILEDITILRNQVAGQPASSVPSLPHALAVLDLQEQLLRVGLISRPELTIDNRIPGVVPIPTQAPRVARTEEDTEGRSERTIRIQIDATALLTRANQRALLEDLESLEVAAQRRRQLFEDRLAGLLASNNVRAAGPEVSAVPSLEIAALLGRTVEDLDREIREFSVKLREESLRQEQLQDAANRTRNVRNILHTKLAEASVASAANGGKAMIASTPTEPRPVGVPPLIPSALAAAFAGLLIGGWIALIREKQVKNSRTRGQSEGSAPGKD